MFSICSEHCRHWFFGGRLVIDGKEADNSLFKMVKSTQEETNPNNLIKFSDNSRLVGTPECSKWYYRWFWLWFHVFSARLVKTCSLLLTHVSRRLSVDACEYWKSKLHNATVENNDLLRNLWKRREKLKMPIQTWTVFCNFMVPWF